MKKLTLLIPILLIAQLANCQITFQKKIGGTNWDAGSSVHEIIGGGYIVAGTTQSFGAGGVDFYLIKTNVNGSVVWTKTFGGASYDILNSIQQTVDSGYIITGYTYSFGAGNEDVYLIKTNANGNLLWSRTFGGTNTEESSSVSQTTDGGYIIIGFTNSFGAGDFDVYLIKTDANGDTLWTKALGGIGYDTGTSVEQTTDGGYIISGGTTSFGSGNNDVYLVKTNVNGDTLWTKTFGGISTNDVGYSVQQTIDGGYIVAGVYNYGSFNSDVYLIKTDTNGDTLWTKTYGGVTNDEGNLVRQTSDSGYIIIGSTVVGSGHDVYLIKTDVNGDTVWTKTYGGTSDEAGSSVAQTIDGGYILVGGKFIGTVNSLYLIKTDSLGNSGCNQVSIMTIVNSPPTQETTPVTTVSSTNTIVGNPASQTGSGGTVTTYCTNVGINELTSENLFFISPNPSSGNFVVFLGEIIAKVNIEIINIIGENVLNENILNESKKEINLKNISAGIYFVKVFDGEKSYCKKLIVE